MQKITTIDPSSNIGDSLININSNYLALDRETTNIEFSARHIWRPLAELYYNKAKEWNQSISIVQTQSSKWIAMCDTVETLSSKWIEPLTMMYPEVFIKTSTETHIVTSIQSWLNNYFPVSSIESSMPSYLEGQEAYIYNFLYESVNKDSIIERRASTICDTIASSDCSYDNKGYAVVAADGTKYYTRRIPSIGSCLTKYHGYVYCSNGNVNCEGVSVRCSQLATANCFYTSPYEPLDSSKKSSKKILTLQNTTNDLSGSNTAYELKPLGVSAYGSINARLSCLYTNRSEMSYLNGYIFKVRQCSWNYVGPTTSAKPLQFQSVPYKPPIQTPSIPLKGSTIKSSTPKLNSIIYLPNPGLDANGVPKIGTWTVPDGVTSVRFTLCGCGGRGADSATKYNDPNMTNSGWGGIIVEKNGFFVGLNGHPSTQARAGGVGSAGGGGGGSSNISNSWTGGGGGGGGPAWARVTKLVTGGTIFEYTFGAMYSNDDNYGCPVDTWIRPLAEGSGQGQQWTLRAGSGQNAPKILDALRGEKHLGGDGGTVVGSTDSPTDKNRKDGVRGGDSYSVYYGGAGATGWDINGNSAGYGGYIAVEVKGVS